MIIQGITVNDALDYMKFYITIRLVILSMKRNYAEDMSKLRIH